MKKTFKLFSFFMSLGFSLSSLKYQTESVYFILMQKFRDFFNQNDTGDPSKDTSVVLTVEGRTFPVDIFYIQRCVPVWSCQWWFGECGVILSRSELRNSQTNDNEE